MSKGGSMNLDKIITKYNILRKQHNERSNKYVRKRIKNLVRSQI